MRIDSQTSKNEKVPELKIETIGACSACKGDVVVVTTYHFYSTKPELIGNVPKSIKGQKKCLCQQCGLLYDEETARKYAMTRPKIKSKI